MVAVASKKKFLEDLDWAKLYRNPKMLAIHMQGLQKDQKGDLLQLAVIKGEGYGQYYSIIDKKPILVPRKDNYFVLPWQNQEYPDYHYLYGHHIAAVGIILRVKKKEVDILGYN